MYKALLHRILPPPEVRETVEHIRAFLKKNATFSRDLLQCQAVRLARQAEKTVTFVTKQYHQPEHLALLLITNVIAQELGQKKYRKSGKILARDMLKVWDVATELMRDKQYYSSFEYQKDCDWIDKKCTWLRTNIAPLEPKK